MKQDVLDALSGKFPKKLPSKETLNHPGIINRLAGFDVYDDTSRAFDIAWRRLGIDVHPPLGDDSLLDYPKGAPTNAPRPKVPGGTWEENGLRYSDIGVYPTTMPVEHAAFMDKSADDWVFRCNTSRDDFNLDQRTEDWRRLNAAFRVRFDDRAVMYHLYYTTLFMWAVVTFGWEPFMLAAATDPVRFDETLWEPWARVSRKNFEALAAMDEEVVFCHDDLAIVSGPVFAPDFYEKHIFPRYEWIMEPVVDAGKKIVFVSDGNLDVFLERLMEFPFAGLMFENPATPFERVLETWGEAGRGFIGGINTERLTFGTPEEVRAHTREVIEKGREYPGFILSSCGGLHGNIPLANLLAYFEARNEMGCPADI